MVCYAVARRVDRDDFVGVWNRFRVDIDFARLFIAEKDRLPRSVDVHGPQMMIMDLRSVDIFPARIEELPVIEDGGRVVLFDIAREFADILAVGTAAVDCRDGRQPALNEAVAARRAEDDISVRKIARLDIVVVAERELTQIFAVDPDLVEIVMFRSFFEIGEENLFAVVTYGRVAERAFFVAYEGFRFAGREVEYAQFAAVVRFERPIFRIERRIVAEIGVPMGIEAGLADGEDDFVRASQIVCIIVQKALRFNRFRLFAEREIIVEEPRALLQRYGDYVRSLFNRALRNRNGDMAEDAGIVGGREPIRIFPVVGKGRNLQRFLGNAVCRNRDFRRAGFVRPRDADDEIERSVGRFVGILKFDFRGETQSERVEFKIAQVHCEPIERLILSDDVSADDAPVRLVQRLPVGRVILEFGAARVRTSDLKDDVRFVLRRSC